MESKNYTGLRKMLYARDASGKRTTTYAVKAGKLETYRFIHVLSMLGFEQVNHGPYVLFVNPASRMYGFAEKMVSYGTGSPVELAEFVTSVYDPYPEFETKLAAVDQYVGPVLEDARAILEPVFDEQLIAEWQEDGIWRREYLLAIEDSDVPMDEKLQRFHDRLQDLSYSPQDQTSMDNAFIFTMPGVRCRFYIEGYSFHEPFRAAVESSKVQLARFGDDLCAQSRYSLAESAKDPELTFAGILEDMSSSYYRELYPDGADRFKYLCDAELKRIRDAEEWDKAQQERRRAILADPALQGRVIMTRDGGIYHADGDRLRKYFLDKWTEVPYAPTAQDLREGLDLTGYDLVEDEQEVISLIYEYLKQLHPHPSNRRQIEMARTEKHDLFSWQDLAYWMTF